ncbi:MAG TPA: LutB/LldF family L-lactate oxidation iron-sulfur protein [Phycisphaerae bacterium]|nr:LutB/LldF family L-lactate oxidation iron-sulfur protein [Phycisphaerae bacterium]HNU44546.1 LutB/LldF family L-lactate oxidation iron-sulfur protein [Phycisphaerae bacterium]
MNDALSPFRTAVAAALADAGLRAALYSATSNKQAVHKTGIDQLHDADALRELAGSIKQHTLDHLDTYLSQFVARVEDRGGHVHFAPTAGEACVALTRIARQHGLRLCVKAKSMTTEEIGLTAALEADGVQVVETDLGEFIVQIDHDRPSHIVTPIIHKNRRVIARAFERELGVAYTEDPQELTQHARRHLRDIFRRCDLGITGVNFAVAETGTICLCTNEGNGRLTLTRPRVHVAVMGIEKLVPRMQDLAVFLKLLARSGTGQPLTCYTSLITGPRRADDADGPAELHVVIVDNGRSDILAGPYRQILRCIRCGACLNACPVYSKIGGHAYDSVYPGPVGKVLSPLLATLARYPDLPQASSLCGLCREVCPVRIDIPGLLVRLRRDQVRQRVVGRTHRRLFQWAGLLLRYPALYRLGQGLARAVLRRRSEEGWVRQAPALMRRITDLHDLRAPAPQSFRTLWTRSRKDERPA